MMPRLQAFLGPTNTGKTHEALRIAAQYHSANLGFPLRLLAREAYDSLCRVLGEDAVALVTGEEQRIPPSATHYCCTVEAMPRDRSFECVVIDEIQFAMHPDRGHHFTWALRHQRGTEHTLWLGAPAMGALLMTIEPMLTIEEWPRFSKLSYKGAINIAKLPQKTAVIAFNLQQVYLIAAQLRQLYGGCAIVMGHLSPRTRTAQVKLFETGQVDYLVATDAIGHGLNLPIRTVAFSSHRKFDGRTRRHLMASEIAQIAGRAGRYKKDGSFCTTLGCETFSEDIIHQVVQHQLPAVSRIRWRSDIVDLSSLDDLCQSLERPPEEPHYQLSRGKEFPVLKAFTQRYSGRALDPNQVTMLWHISKVPDYGHLGLDMHLRDLYVLADAVVHSGQVSRDAIAPAFDLCRIDPEQKSIEELLSLLYQVRFWSAVNHKDLRFEHVQSHLSQMLVAQEERVSDLVHQGLMQRYVNQLNEVKKSKHSRLPLKRKDNVIFHHDRSVGKIRGLWFDPETDEQDNNAIAQQVKLLEADYLAQHFASLAKAPTKEFHFAADRLCWQRLPLCQVRYHHRLEVQPIRNHSRNIFLYDDINVNQLAQTCHLHARKMLSRSLGLWFFEDWPPLQKASAALRAILFQLRAQSGAIKKREVQEHLSDLTGQDKQLLKRAGIRIGYHTIYHPKIQQKTRRMMLELRGDHRSTWSTFFEYINGKTCLERPQSPLSIDPLLMGFLRYHHYLVRIDFLEDMIQEAFSPNLNPSAWTDKWRNRLGVDEKALSALLPQHKGLRSLKRHLDDASQIASKND